MGIGVGMSARASGQVWKLSAHKGSELLVLLAIADNAKDDGRDAWPSVPELARKTRLTERNIQVVLRKLEASGELRIEKNAGPHRANLYHIVLDGENFSPLGGEKIAPLHPEKIAPSDGEKIAPPDGEKISGVKSFQGEIQRIEMVKSGVLSGAIPPRPPYKEELIRVNRPFNRQREGACAPAREGFSPAHPSLSEEQYAEAEGMGLTREQAETATAQWADRRIERGTSSDDWVRNHRTFLRAYVEKLPAVGTRPGANGHAPSASLAPVIVPEGELTPVERAWRGASEEERAMGQRAFTARFNAEHREDEA
jgi:hypothetical protein